MRTGSVPVNHYHLRRFDQSMSRRLSTYSRVSPSPKTKASVQYFITFCTRYKRAWLRQDMHACIEAKLAEAAESLGIAVFDNDIEENCVNVTCSIPVQYAPHEAVVRIRKYIGWHLRERYPELTSKSNSLWERGFLIHTIGEEPTETEVASFVAS